MRFALDFQLVRVYHPDSAYARTLPPETVQSQFQAIARAYDILSGRAAGSMSSPDTSGTDQPRRSHMNDLSTAMWKYRQARKADIDVAFDERWKGRLLGGLLIFVRDVLILLILFELLLKSGCE